MPPSPGLVRSLHIIENTIVPPQLIIELVDQKNTLRSDLALVDGTLMEIEFGSSKDTAETISARVFGSKEIEDGQRVLRIVALLDAPGYLFDTKTIRVQGTSKQALEKVSSDYGLTLDCDLNPSDSMVWISVASSPRLFVQDIEKHMWVSDSAFPTIMTTFDKRLLVRDLNKVITGEPETKAVFHSTGDKDEVIFEELVPMSNSGVFNAVSNYGDKAVWSNEDGESVQVESVSITTNDNPNVNSDVRGNVQSSRVRQLPPSPDSNAHKNWHLAKYTWQRQSLAYTETARGLVRGQVDIPLLSCLELKSGRYSERAGEEREDEKNSFKWVVIGKTRSLISGSYLESYMITRNYTTIEGNTQVGGGANQATKPAPTAASPQRPVQIDQNIKQNPVDAVSNAVSSVTQVTTPMDAYVMEYENKIAALDIKFEGQSEIFAFKELVDKYGESGDFLEFLLREFSIARLISMACGALNMLEKLSINLTLDLMPDILQGLSDRLDEYSDLLESATTGLNNLIASGDVPAEYVSGVKINQRCVSNKIDDLTNAINDALPDKCVEAKTVGKLNRPKQKLGNKVRQLEEFLRDLLCALGDGTVDKSSLEGAPDFGEIKDYMPGVKDVGKFI